MVLSPRLEIFENLRDIDAVLKHLPLLLDASLSGPK